MNKEEFIAKKATIQEKIDAVKREMMDLKQAYMILTKTTMLGSVCGRICPGQKFVSLIHHLKVGLLIIENAYIFQKREDMPMLKDTKYFLMKSFLN